MSKQVYLLGVGVALVALAFAVTHQLLTPPPGVTEANVTRLRPGMTLNQVEAILGDRPTAIWPSRGFGGGGFRPFGGFGGGFTPFGGFGTGGFGGSGFGTVGTPVMQDAVGEERPTENRMRSKFDDPSRVQD